MADESLAGLLVVSRDIVGLHPAEDCLQNLFVFGAADATGGHGNHGVGMTGVEAGYRAVFSLLDRDLFLVPVVPGFLHADDGMHDRIDLFGDKAADPDQVLTHLFLLESKLFCVVQGLNLAAAAGPGNGTAGFHTGRGRLQDPVEMAVCIAGSHLCKGHFNRVSGHRVFDKDGKSIFRRFLFSGLCSCILISISVFFFIYIKIYIYILICIYVFIFIFFYICILYLI